VTNVVEMDFVNMVKFNITVENVTEGFFVFMIVRETLAKNVVH
jgi:hypothetical protein